MSEADNGDKNRCSVCGTPFVGHGVYCNTTLRGDTGEWQCSRCYAYYREHGRWPDEDGKAGQSKLGGFVSPSGNDLTEGGEQ